MMGSDLMREPDPMMWLNLSQSLQRDPFVWDMPVYGISGRGKPHRCDTRSGNRPNFRRQKQRQKGKDQRKARRAQRRKAK